MARFRPYQYAFRLAKVRLPLLWLAGLTLIGLQLVAPVQVGRLTNLFAQGNTTVSLSVVGGAVLTIVAAQIGVSIIKCFQAWQIVYIRQTMTRSLSNDLFRRILRYPSAFFFDRKVEGVNTRALEDSRAVVNTAVQLLVTIPVAISMIVVLAVFLISQNWLLGVCVIPLALLSGYFLLFDRQIQQLNRRQREVWDAIRVNANELIVGAGELRCHSAAQYGLQRLDRQFDAYREVMTGIGRWSAFLEATRPVVETLQTSVLYWGGALLCVAGTWFSQVGGQMTWGDVIQFMLVVILFQQPVQQVSIFLLRWRMNREQLRRVRDLAEQPVEYDEPAEDLADAAPKETGDINLRDVGLVTSEGIRILDSVDAVIPQGRRTAIVGPAGCGKSTLMQAIVRETTPTSGEVVIGSENVERLPRRWLSRSIGYVSQKPMLFNASIRDNILLALRRCSTRTISDESGCIDVSMLNDVTTMDDLDQKLLETVSLVHLDQDLFHKGLDQRLPTAGGFGRLRSRLVACGERVQNHFREVEDPPVVPFDEQTYLQQGRYGENLFGPNRPWDAWSARDKRRVVNHLEAKALARPLLSFVIRRLRTDRSLATRLPPQLTRLQAVLRYATVAGAQEPFDERLAELTCDERQALLGIAFACDAMEVAREAGEDNLVERTLQARHLMLADQELTEAFWANPRKIDERLSVREILLCGRPNRQVFRARERCDKVICDILREQGVHREIILLGMEYGVGENGKFLSGGQRQKVSLARTLLKQPSILLLDEATASLDQLSQSIVDDTLRTELAGRTRVVISHRLATLTDYDQLLVLEGGRVVQKGRYDELLEQAGTLRELTTGDGESSPSRDTGATADIGASTSEIQAARTAISNCRLFQGLSGDSLEFLSRRATISFCEEGEILFHRGDEGEELFIVVEGAVELFNEPASGKGDKRTSIATVSAGGSFGELALLGAPHRSVGARAKTPLQLCILTAKDLMRILDSDSQVAVDLLQTLARLAGELADELYAPKT